MALLKAQYRRRVVSTQVVAVAVQLVSRKASPRLPEAAPSDANNLVPVEAERPELLE
jgi:hypothetical protein